MVIYSSISYSKTINILDYGADSNGKIECSNIFQSAIKELENFGGGRLYIPQGDYFIQYPIFVPSNINIIGDGIKTKIRANISVAEGRCAFVIGNSYEWNLQKAAYNRSKKLREWLVNKSYKDRSIKECLKRTASDKTIEARNSSIQNLYIEFDYLGCKSNWGGYGIQFCNAADCFASDIWTKNACQAIGIGSDVPPSTPGCVNVYCYNIHVVQPDPIQTYYAIGFIASSNNCGIINSNSLVQMRDNSENGTIVAVNFVLKCRIENIRGSVGRTKISEGVLLNNAYGCIVKNICINNAKKGIVTSFTDYDYLLSQRSLRNKIDSVKILNSDIGVSLLSKYNDFSNVDLENCITPLRYNINATNNIFTNFIYMKQLPIKQQNWLNNNNVFR